MSTSLTATVPSSPVNTTSGIMTTSNTSRDKNPRSSLDTTKNSDSLTLFSSSSHSTTNTATNTHTHSEKKKHILPQEALNLLAGGLSGMTAKSFIAPLDRIKILYQCTSAHFSLQNVPNVISAIYHEEGLRALWKGHTATLLRVFPYAGLQFMSYDFIKNHILSERLTHRQQNELIQKSSATEDKFLDTYRQVQERQKGERDMLLLQKEEIGVNSTTTTMTTFENLMAGMGAGLISSLCTYPLDLTRAQLAVQTNTASTSTTKTTKHTLRKVFMKNVQERGIGGLYRGITPTILGIMPYSGAAFTINEQSKAKIRAMYRREPNTLEKVLCGGISGLVAQSFTYPLEVVRRRMQTHGLIADHQISNSLLRSNTADNTSKNTTPSSSGTSAINTNKTKPPTPMQNHPTSTTTLSMTQIAKQLYKEQGIRGFFKGLSMNWMKGPIAFSISFTTYDIMKEFLRNAEQALL